MELGPLGGVFGDNLSKRLHCKADTIRGPNLDFKVWNPQFEYSNESGCDVNQVTL